MIMRIILAILCLFAFAPVAQAQDAAATKPTGECTLAEGGSTAPDGSCGTWTAKLKSAESEKPNRKKNKLKVTPVIDFAHLRASWRSARTGARNVAVYFCVTTGHNAYKDDKLIIAVRGARDQSVDYCKERGLQGTECVKQSSKQDLNDCGKVKENRPPMGGGLRWCVDHNYNKEAKECRYLLMRFGETLSVWITKTEDDSFYREERSASGTWTLVK